MSKKRGGEISKTFLELVFKEENFRLLMMKIGGKIDRYIKSFDRGGHLFFNQGITVWWVHECNQSSLFSIESLC